MAKILRQRIPWLLAGVIAGEAVLIFSAVVLAVYFRLGAEAVIEMIEFEALIPKTLLIAVVCQVCLYFADLYDLRIVVDRRELVVRAIRSLGVTSLLLAAVYYWFPDFVIGRGVFLIAAGLVITFVVGWRAVFEWFAGRVWPRERLLLVGTNTSAISLASELYRRRDLGVEIVGFIDPDPARVGTPIINPAVIGSIRDIPEIVRGRNVDRVVVSLADARGTLPMDQLLEMKLNGVTFDHLASVYEEYTGKIAVENLRPSWLIFSSGFKKSRVLSAAKRGIDLTAAAIGLILALPLMIVAALAIKCTSRGPVLYHQARVGQHGMIFMVHKFRSMRQDAEAGTGAVWAAAADCRVTSFGRVLRRTRLDELPQLWNVLKGHMSFVGPRPERPEFVQMLTQQIPFYGQRHVVKPGITGWAQVRYTYGASVEDAMEKLQHDLFYIKNMSIALDLFIILKTVKTVLLRRGAQ